jgi:hypothetical protein
MPILGTQSSRSGGTPTAPTSVSASAGNGQATVTFTESSYTGKGSVTYTAISSPGNFTATGTSPITVTGLTNGTAYTFTVRATSSTGETATSSASSSTTPVAPEFMARVYNSVNFDMAIQGAYVDASGNVYTVGYRQTDLYSQKYAFVIKQSADGTLLWQKQLARYLDPQNRRVAWGRSVWADSSGNVYVNASEVPSNDNYDYQHFLLTKLDSSGNTVWQKLYNGPADPGGTPQHFINYSHVGDSSGDTYYAGEITDTGTQNADYALTKVGTDGTHAWTYYYAYTGDQGSGNAFRYMATDFSGVPHATGYYYTSTTISKGVYVDHQTWNVVKFTTAGAISWARKFYDYSYYNVSSGMAIDSSGNVYTVGYSNKTGAYQLHLVKHDASGALQWQRRLTTSGTPSYGTRVSCDSSGNVYVLGGETTTSSAILLKYNSSGIIQWQRKIVANASSMQRHDLYVSGTSLVIVGNFTNGSYYNGYVVKVPTDGSKTGTYTVGGISYVYSTPSHTEDAGNMSEASENGLTRSSARSITTSTGASTVEAGALTVATTSI